MIPARCAPRRMVQIVSRCQGGFAIRSIMPETKTRRLLRPIVRAYERFLKIRGNPREIALGMALGLFVGMTPLMGLHTLMAVPLAAMFKWNKISAAVGVWVTNALTAPIIYGINYLVGARILGLSRSFGFEDTDGLSALYRLMVKTPEIFWATTIGGIVLGVPLAAAGYYFAYSVVHKYQAGIKTKLNRSKERRAQKNRLRKKRTPPPLPKKKGLNSTAAPPPSAAAKN
jgi:uncharacterized protein (DUF2062 family)